jgi:hypothetical protein
VQVADRFHLWQSLAEAVEKTVITHRGALRAPEPDPVSQETAASPAGHVPAPAATTAPGEPDGFRDIHGHERRLVTRHRERHAAVQALLAEGCSIREIARRLDLDPDTASKFARAASIDELLVRATTRASILDPHKAYVNQRRNDGITSTAVMHAELQGRGWKGDIQTVARYMKQFRTVDGRTRAGKIPQPGPAAPAAPPPPKPRRVVRWLMTRPDHLDHAAATALAQILARSPELAATAAHIRDFATMMTHRQGQRLDQWIAGVRASPLPALHTFANGLQRDYDAVLAGLTLPYSSGAVEGKNRKIKYLKRLMYGRANLDLLRKMVLLN